MRIERASVVRVGGPLPAPVANVRVRWTERRGLLLRLFDERGNVGQGEASPLPGYSPDDLEMVRTALGLCPWTCLEEIDEQAPLLPQVRHVVERVDAAVPSARFAVETALLDLVGRRIGRPVADLLADGAPCGPVAVSRLIGLVDGEALPTARRAWARGVRTLKVKVGLDFEAEMSLLRALRSELGDDLSLRVDANQSFDPADAPRLLRELGTVRPELVEEPVPSAALERMESSPVPLAMDESLRGEAGERRLRDLGPRGLVRFVVLKPMVLGGVLRCMELARRARATGIEPVVSHTFGGPVALTAAASLAVALPTPRRAAGVERHDAWRAWPEIDLPMLRPHELVPSDEPGLGIAMVPAAR